MGPCLTHCESETSHPPNMGALLVLKAPQPVSLLTSTQTGNQSGGQIQGQPANGGGGGGRGACMGLTRP